MSHNDPPQGNDIVVGGAESTVGPAPVSGPVYQYEYPTATRGPAIDSVESAKMTPQILVLLVIAGIRRNWKWALPSGVILAALAFAILYLSYPKKYEATAWIQILANQPYFVYSEQQSRQYESFVNTQFSLMRSPIILEKALESPEVARLACVMKEKDKTAWLARELRLNRQGRSEMSTVSIETEERDDADKIVNAVVNAFFEYYDSQGQDWNTKLINQLTLELNRQKALARQLQQEIRDNMQKAAQEGGVAGETGVAAGMAPTESILRDVYLAESKLESLNAELQMLKESKEESPTRISDQMIEQAIRSDPMLLSLQEQHNYYMNQIESLKRTLARKDDPKILGYEKRVKEIEQHINDYMSNAGGSVVQNLQRGLTADLDRKIWDKEMEVRSQQILVENLRKKYGEQTASSSTRTGRVVDVTFQQQQLARVNTVLDLLENRVVSLQTELHAPAQIQLKKKANPPAGPKDAKRIPMAALGAFCCLCFPLFLGVTIERLKPRLYHVSQIRRSIPNVIIGEIMEPPVAWIHGATFRKRLARYRESVHNWCTHLLLSDPFRRCRTLAVASVSGDDGKTFLAVQVAVAMAQMKSGPVLLIDGDMRVGRLHLLFGNEETGVGLADVLSFRNGFGEAVVMNEKEPNLHLLSAGQLDVSPYELLGDGRFRELLDTLENHYSLILVVVPPVANAAESLVMSASTDSVLLCVRQGETVLAAMEDVFRKLVNTGSSVDGIVVKDIPYYQMAGKDGGFADKLEQVRLAHLLQYAD